MTQQLRFDMLAAHHSCYTVLVQTQYPGLHGTLGKLTPRPQFIAWLVTQHNPVNEISVDKKHPYFTTAQQQTRLSELQTEQCPTSCLGLTHQECYFLTPLAD
jgi:hypothetical protein